MRLSDLRDAKLRRLDGKLLGKVHEVHCDDGRITALSYGPASFLERLTANSRGKRIAWGCVRRVERDQIIVASGPVKAA